MWCCVVNLVTISESDSSLADAISSGTKTSVFADKRSIRQSEFYQASASGLNPTVMFIVRTIDYSDQSLLEYDGVAYNIIRTYSRPDELTELVCARV